jgi:hypothetical protein
MLKYDGNLATLKEVQKEYQQKGIRKGRMQVWFHSNHVG